jgi:hypothetical protein
MSFIVSVDFLEFHKSKSGLVDWLKKIKITETKNLIFHQNIKKRGQKVTVRFLNSNKNVIYFNKFSFRKTWKNLMDKFLKKCMLLKHNFFLNRQTLQIKQLLRKYKLRLIDTYILTNVMSSKSICYRNWRQFLHQFTGKWT